MKRLLIIAGLIATAALGNAAIYYVAPSGSSGSGTGGGGHTIQNNGVSFPQQVFLNFTGPAVSVSDTGGKTVVNITGVPGPPGPAGGGILTSLNGSAVPDQTFVNGTNITVSTAAGAHTIGISGTIADANIASASVWNAKLSANGTATDSSKLGGQLPAFYQTALGYTPVNNAGNETIAGTKTFSSAIIGALTGNATTATNLAGSVTLPTGISAVTQTAGNNSTLLATTAYVASAVSAAGGGNVSNVSTPLNDQIGVWTGATTIKGTDTLPAGSKAVTQSQANNSTLVATTAYVDTGLAGKAGTSSNFNLGTTALALNRASASVALTGVSIDGTSGSTAGNALTATTLQNARLINGVSFNGSANITITDATKEPTITGGTTSQYWRGDKSFQTINLDALSDVVISTPLTNQWLAYNGSTWLNKTCTTLACYGITDAGGAVLTTASNPTSTSDTTGSTPALINAKISNRRLTAFSNCTSVSSAGMAVAVGTKFCNIAQTGTDPIIYSGYGDNNLPPNGTNVLLFDTSPAGTSGTGTVTSITAGTGLSGGTITGSGTIALSNTSVTAGAYTNASLTVDAQGRLTAASSGSASGMGNPMTATGDIIVGGSGGTPARLPIGVTQGMALTVLGGTPSWTTPANPLATYIVQTATNSPANAQALASLATGIVKNTTTTGVLSIAAAGTDYVAPSGSITGSSNSVKSNATTGILQIAGPATATTRVMTVPDANFTVATTTGTEILSNKELAITGTSLTTGSAYYMGASGLALAKADSASTLPAICVAISATQCAYSGEFTTGSWTRGNQLYVSAATAGLLTDTAPSTAGQFLQKVGIATSTTSILILPNLTIVGI